MNHVDTLKNVLKNEGLRYTQQRQIIWDEIRNSSEHRDAEEIYFEIKTKNQIKVSRATVYRTIDVLVKNKLVRKLELGDGKALYENKIDEAHHDHMICVQCGRIEEFVNDDIEKIQDEIVKSFDYKMIRHIHQLFVLCNECQ